MYQLDGFGYGLFAFIGQPDGKGFDGRYLDTHYQNIWQRLSDNFKGLQQIGKFQAVAGELLLTVGQILRSQYANLTDISEIGESVDQNRLTAILQKPEGIEAGDARIEQFDIFRPRQPAELGVNADAEAVVPVQFVAETNDVA